MSSDPSALMLSEVTSVASAAPTLAATRGPRSRPMKVAGNSTTRGCTFPMTAASAVRYRSVE